MDIRIDDDLKALAQQFPKAGQAVLNRTAAEARTVVAAEVTNEYNVTAAIVRKRISLIKSTKERLIATLRFSQRGFAPILFVNPNIPTTRREAVYLELKKGNRIKLPKDWFIQRGKKSGKKNIFTQLGNNRGELALMKYLNGDKIFDFRKINPTIQRFAEQRMSKELPRVIEAFYKAGK